MSPRAPMALKCGIVGLPNVGKSTLFNALTESGAAAENYPFCTIEPNTGRAPLSDSRLAKVAAAAHSARIVPAAAEFVDIAGLIAGAAQNAGLGNRFLSHIRETNGIAHIVRCFEDGDITHVAGRVSPADDIAVVNTELALADLETTERTMQKNAKIAKSGDAESRVLLSACEKLAACLGAGESARNVLLDEKESAAADSLFLLTRKPVLYIANTDENDANDNPHVRAAADLAAAENAPFVVICAQTEADMAGLSESEKEEMLRDFGRTQTGLSLMARAAFDMLGLATYFTAGEKEARAWTFRRGMTAPQAAGVIHTDFMRGFIRAEICDWRDFVELGGEAATRTAGKLRAEGKEYPVQDGDVIHFRVR